jgi:hypothetical protein
MNLLAHLAGWRGYALTAALMLVVGFGTGWTVHGWKFSASAAATEIQYRDRIIYRERAQTAVTDRAEAKAVVRETEIRTVTQTLIKEVKVYVPVQADARYALPDGLVRLHDAAALGLPLPDGAGQSDDPAGFLEPSLVAPSELGTAIIENYGRCRIDQAKLAGLQDWIRAQTALSAES